MSQSDEYIFLNTLRTPNLAGFVYKSFIINKNDLSKQYFIELTS